MEGAIREWSDLRRGIEKRGWAKRGQAWVRGSQPAVNLYK